MLGRRTKDELETTAHWTDMRLVSTGMVSYVPMYGTGMTVT
jgi:hypothetical protein